MAVEDNTSEEGSQASDRLRVPKKRSKDSKRSKENPPPAKSSDSSTSLAPQPQLGGNPPAGLKTTGLPTDKRSATTPTPKGDKTTASKELAIGQNPGGSNTTPTTTTAVAGSVFKPSVTLASQMAANTATTTTPGTATKHSAVPASTSTSYHDGNFDPSTTSGSQKWRSFTENTLGKRLSVNVASRNEILAYVGDKFSLYNMTLLHIPCKGDGRSGLNPNTINGVNVASYDLRDYRDVLDAHQYEVPSTALAEFSGWIHGSENEYRAARAPSDMISRMVNVTSTGNSGLVAQRKVELRREDNMFFEMLQNVIAPEDMRGFNNNRIKFTYATEGYPGKSERSGLLLWVLIRERIYPLTKICTKDLETELKDLTFETCNLNVDNLIIKIDDLVKRIEAEKRTAYDKDEYMAKIFDVLGTYKQEDLVFELRMQKSAYHNGKASSLEAVEALKTCYKNAVAAKTWGNLDVTKKEITLLTTKIAAQQKEIARLKNASGDGTKPSTKKSGKNKSSNKDNSDKAWMVTFAGNTKKDSKGDAYEWCKLCGPGRSKGTPAGLYMKSPHNHKEWLANKKARQEEYNASKAKKQSETDSSTKRKGKDDGKAEKDSIDSKKMKLKLADSIVDGLTTHMSISAHDARQFVDKQFSEFDADNQISPDNKSLN